MRRAMMLLALLALAVAAQMATQPGADVSWLLYSAWEVLHGARLGVDVLENTPPMIYAFKVPAVAFAELVGVSAWGTWVLAVTGIGVLVSDLSTNLAGYGGGRRRLPFTATLAGILLLVPGNDFGQREHLTTLLVLPYLAVVASRINGVEPDWRKATIAGLLAGCGVGIKPFFALVPIAVAVAVYRRRGVRGVVAVEQVTIAMIGGLYVGIVATLLPEYIAYARLFGPLYRDFLTQPTLFRLAPYEGGAAMALVGLGVFAALGRNVPPARTAVCTTLAAATAAFYVVGVVQGKGWRYQFLPGALLGLVLTALVAYESRGARLRRIERIYMVVAFASLGSAIVPAVLGAMEWTAHWGAPRPGSDPNIPPLSELLTHTPDSSYVAVLSTNIASGFPLVPGSARRWALRFPSLWPMVAFRKEQMRTQRQLQSPPLAQRTPLERKFDRDVVEDLERRTPSVILVPWPRPVFGAGAARRFDYLGYFGAERRFSELLLSSYFLVGTVGSYQVFWRQGLVVPSKVQELLRIDETQLQSTDRPGLKWLSLIGAVLGFLYGVGIATGSGFHGGPEEKGVGT